MVHLGGLGRRGSRGRGYSGPELNPTVTNPKPRAGRELLLLAFAFLMVLVVLFGGAALLSLLV